MKKSIFAVLFALIVPAVFSLTACTEQNTPGQTKTEEVFDTTIDVNVALSGQKTEVNKYIYGQFIEHIEDGVYDGIWAEMVLDRKFYYPIGKKGLSPWSYTDVEKVESNQEVTLSGGYSAKITAGGGIYQSKLTILKKEYTGYLNVHSETGCKVRITLSYKDNSVSTEVTVSPNEKFTKYDYSLTSDFAAYGYVKYELDVVSGEGYFDSISLMPADNYKGIRRDTLEALKDLNSPIYRWPGGNFVSGYDWYDGIGDKDTRPSRRNLHYMGLESDFSSVEAMETSDMINLNSYGFYGGIEPNDFGLDEFMAMCEYLGADALMMVNSGLGTAQKAADQVEYCNGAATTFYGAKRAENGHAEPYNIKYWGIGNEMFGSWQLGHVNANEYAQRHNEFALAMKAVDGSIKLVASGENSSSWDESLFSASAGNFDLIAEHGYPEREDYDIFKHVKNMKNMLDGRVKNHRALLNKYPTAGAVTIAFTEYSYADAVCPSRVKDGLGVAEFLNVMINNADVFEMACYSSTVNTTQGCITTEPDGAVMQGAGYVLKLYTTYMRGYSVVSAVKYNAAIQLDVSATASADGKKVCLAVVNPSDSAVRINWQKLNDAKSVTRHTFTGDFADSFNSVAKKEMYIEDVTNLSNAVAPAISVTIFEIEL